MTSTSDEDLLQLNALADGELDGAEAEAIKLRLTSDPALKTLYDTILASREAVGRMGRPTVTADFLRRIEAITEPQPEQIALPPRRRTAFDGWRQIAASVLVTAFVASSATYLIVGKPGGPSIDDLVASSHRRSLLAASPVDILTSDRHTVKPWLDARLGVSPPATDLATQGYPLVGGRVEVLGQQAVPALVYRHNEHTITVIAVPGSNASTVPRDLPDAGYNMVRWSGAGFDYWAVSDLEASELDTFVADYRAATGQRG